MQIHFLVTYITLFLLLGACQSYKQNILFRVGDDTDVTDSLTYEDKNRIIAIGDFLQIEVFTNDGERIIDPDFELIQTGTNINAGNLRPRLKYLVRNDGYVKLPMVGDVHLLGNTIYEAEDILQQRYEKFYKNSFVNLIFLNKRVVVLGSPGGRIIPLENENITLVEVIAMAEGIDNDGKGHNIRLIRGNQVFVADLTSIEGFMAGNVVVEPGDIIYIEPVRRPFVEFVRENGPIFNIVTTLVSLTVVLLSLN